MFNKKYAACFILLLFNTAVQAELFVVKEVAGKVVPLDVSDWDNYKGDDGIFGILQKYQWPMNTVSDLTKEEQQEVFAEKPDAERIFIEKKIKEKFPTANYKVKFIPTTLYELFAVLMAHEEPFGEWENIRSKIFEKDMFETMLEYFQKYHTPDLSLNNTVVLNELLTWGYLVSGTKSMEGFHGFIDFDKKICNLMSNKNKIQLQPTDIRKKIFALYTDVNNHQVSAQVHFLFNWYLGHRMLNTYDKKDFCDVAAVLIKTIALKSEATKSASTEDKYCNACTKELSQKSRGSFLLSTIKENELNENSQLRPDGIIARTLKLEISAEEKNEGLLFRGASLLDVSVPKKAPFDKNEKKIPTEEKKIIGSSLETWRPSLMSSVENIAKSYKEDTFKPYSISYGITLLAGLFFDSPVSNGAMAYGYLCNHGGYALRINKLQYRISLGKLVSTLLKTDLFFIPPINTLVGLFAQGEFFHARAKACTPEDPTRYSSMIRGLLGARPPDYSGLFLIQSDPLKHAAKFSQFIADHAVILSLKKSSETPTNLTHEEQEGVIKAAQKESAQYFGAIPKLKQFIDKVPSIRKTEEYKLRLKKYTEEQTLKKKK